jgi:hypothetical protein
VLAAALAAFALAAAPAGGGTTPPPAPEPSTATSIAIRTAPEGWFFLPIVFWLPETKLGFGLGTGRDFRVEGAPRASNVFIVAGAAVGGQGSVDTSTDVYLRGGTLLTGRFRLVYYPDAYYGIGPDTAQAARENYTRFFVAALSTVEHPFTRALRAGVRVDGRLEGISHVTPGGPLATSGLPGLDGYGALGAGPLVTWDTRDRPLWPSSGAFVQANYVLFPGWLTTGGAFGKGVLDLRWFHGIHPRWIFATSGVLETNDGATPFQILAKIGNSQSFRGYPEGRFRDNIVWAAQAELRVELTRKLAAVAFGALGNVAPSLHAIDLRHVKGAGGGGARWRLTGEGANLRIDVAAGREGPQLYVLLLEAF